MADANRLASETHRLSAAKRAFPDSSVRIVSPVAVRSKRNFGRLRATFIPETGAPSLSVATIRKLGEVVTGNGIRQRAARATTIRGHFRRRRFTVGLRLARRGSQSRPGGCLGCGCRGLRFG